MNRILLALAAKVLIAVGLATCAGCGGSSRAGANPSAPANGRSEDSQPGTRVVAAKPLRKTIRRITTEPGRIEAFEQTAIFAKLPAYVGVVHLDIGDRAKANQPLADLSIPELVEEARQKDAQLVLARASVDQALAAIRAVDAAITTARAGIAEARAGIIRATGKYDRWKSEDRRMGELLEAKAIDRQQVDETRNELRAAEATQGEAEAKVAGAEALLVERQASLAKANADLAVANANVKNAEADQARVEALLRYTRVCMPYAGIVIERNVNRGDFVQPASAAGKPLFVVARGDVVRIFVDVPEMEASLVKTGSKATIAVQALPGRKIEGTVTRTSWALGPNRTLRTELDIPNPDDSLQPGMYATAEIVLQERRDVLTLPVDAVVRTSGQAFCYCAEDGTLVKRSIAVGLQTPVEVEVIFGLTGGEIVVRSQTASLREGQRVEVSPSERSVPDQKGRR